MVHKKKWRVGGRSNSNREVGREINGGRWRSGDTTKEIGENVFQKEELMGENMKLKWIGAKEIMVR